MLDLTFHTRHALHKRDPGAGVTLIEMMVVLVMISVVAARMPRSCPAEGFLTVFRRDPWGTPYVYRAEAGRFDLISLGADAAIGGEGVNADIPLRDTQSRAGL